MTRLAELLDEARQDVSELTAHDARNMIENCDRNLVLLDIREREATTLGYIKGATHVPENVLQMHAENVVPEKETPVLLYCGTGIRSLLTAKTLKDLGYKDVRSIQGGFNAWKDAGYEVISDSALSQEQLDRYSRQIILKEIGEEGQLRLMNARVLIVGMGGLGSPIALYLAECGVGTLGIVDFDRVGFSNLNRQVLHIQANVGRPKTESAKEAIARANPAIKVITFEERLEPHNALDLVHDFDIIIDGADNIPTKYLLNDAAFFAGKPYIFGAAIRFEGQAGVFSPKDGGPCLRCMFPRPPEPAMAPT
jgi:molybdopterin/thiamine biosynthesis adenylyltransferase/rhodanese-related sulfurtransferase